VKLGFAQQISLQKALYENRYLTTVERRKKKMKKEEDEK
jgi:hypothetical protein